MLRLAVVRADVCFSVTLRCGDRMVGIAGVVRVGGIVLVGRIVLVVLVVLMGGIVLVGGLCGELLCSLLVV